MPWIIHLFSRQNEKEKHNNSRRRRNTTDPHMNQQCTLFQRNMILKITQKSIQLVGVRVRNTTWLKRQNVHLVGIPPELLLLLAHVHALVITGFPFLCNGPILKWRLAIVYWIMIKEKKKKRKENWVKIFFFSFCSLAVNLCAHLVIIIIIISNTIHNANNKSFFLSLSSAHFAMKWNFLFSLPTFCFCFVKMPQQQQQRLKNLSTS